MSEWKDWAEQVHVRCTLARHHADLSEARLEEAMQEMAKALDVAVFHSGATPMAAKAIGLMSEAAIIVRALRFKYQEAADNPEPRNASRSIADIDPGNDNGGTP